MRSLRPLLLAGLCALLALPAAASAAPAGARGMAATFPHATALCAKVAAGQAPKRLAGSADKVTAACTTLARDFTATQTTFRAARTSLRTQARTAIATARATCAQARAAGDRAACRAAVRQARGTLRGLRTQLRTARTAYHQGVQAERKAFWTTIRALAGGSTVAPDRTVGPDPGAALPAV
ncbi:hypothetical protein FSW04_10425 [Baekduia soli]|uniref:Uncharacterized protein n=1 Tax=Baekduia soli TaxID=496014 RepID=A0A5B8U4F9_9ACTN|nr:hypothetical protein [Baekduia soli]QEC47943.1 hypothetical protein FSW04_10425 [Baekduia soli]